VVASIGEELAVFVDNLGRFEVSFRVQGKGMVELKTCSHAVQTHRNGRLTRLRWHFVSIAVNGTAARLALNGEVLHFNPLLTPLLTPLVNPLLTPFSTPY